MKKFLSLCKWSCGLLAAFFVIAWVGFPYLFSNEAWEVKTKLKVREFSRTADRAGSASDFPDARIVHLLYAEDGTVSQVGYLYDILDGSAVNEGDTVYMYSLGGKLCMSHYEIGVNYALRWKYLWYCDPSPAYNIFLFVLFCAFLGSTVIALRSRS